MDTATSFFFFPPSLFLSSFHPAGSKSLRSSVTAGVFLLVRTHTKREREAPPRPSRRYTHTDRHIRVGHCLLKKKKNSVDGDLHTRETAESLFGWYFLSPCSRGRGRRGMHSAAEDDQTTSRLESSDMTITFLV